MAIVATLYRPLAFGYQLLDVHNVAPIVMLILFVLLAAIKRKWFHVIVVRSTEVDCILPGGFAPDEKV